MISSRTGAAICCAIVAAAGVAGCGSSGSGSKDSKKVAVTLVDDGCTPSQIKVASGPVTFDITNGGTSKVSEMELKNSSGIILGESENVVEGVPGRFSLNLKPGNYVVSCPNGDKEDQGKLVASGTAGFDVAKGFASNGYGDHSPGHYSLFAGFLMEVVMTMMFLFIIMGATHGSAPVGFAPLAIGLALALTNLAAIPVTNASINPARSTPKNATG